MVRICSGNDEPTECESSDAYVARYLWIGLILHQNIRLPVHTRSNRVMKQTIIGLIALTSLIGAGIAYTFSDQPLHSTLSPSHTYRVEISQKRDSAGYERFVYLNAYRGGEPFVRDKLLYTDDWLDEDFRELYPNYPWVSDSILKIGRDFAETQSNDLRITNATPEQISYLLIETYGDKYVLFDVEPESVIDLRFQFIGQLSCQGAFAESQKRFGSAVRLFDDAEGEVQGGFSIEVKEEDAIIESPDLRLKRVTCCAVDRPDIYHEDY